MGFPIAVVFYDAHPLVDRISADQFFKLTVQVNISNTNKIKRFQCRVIPKQQTN